MAPRVSTRRVRVPLVSHLRDNEAKKILVPAERADAPPLELVLVRRDGRLYALDSLCPHEGGRFSEGPLWEGRYVSCPLHLYRFDPATGECAGIQCERATTHPVREVDGVAEIELPRDAPDR